MLSEKKRDNSKQISIRLDTATWKKLRRMQEDGKIRSIQHGVEEGVKLLINSGDAAKQEVGNEKFKI
jgi:hypothetical protein